MGLLRALERILGTSKHPSTRISTAAARFPDDAAMLAETSKAMTREHVELQPRGPAATGLTTDDVNADTGRLYDDYLARRALREAGRRAARDNTAGGVVDHDVKPL